MNEKYTTRYMITAKIMQDMFGYEYDSYDAVLVKAFLVDAWNAAYNVEDFFTILPRAARETFKGFAHLKGCAFIAQEDVEEIRAKHEYAIQCIHGYMLLKMLED